MPAPKRVSKTYRPTFSFAEMTANSNGKTSGSGVAGLLIVLIGALSFITGVLLIVAEKNPQDLLIQSIAIIYAGAALLGVRKLRNTRNYYEREDYGLHGDFSSGHDADNGIQQSDEPL